MTESVPYGKHVRAHQQAQAVLIADMRVEWMRPDGLNEVGDVDPRLT